MKTKPYFKYGLVFFMKPDWIASVTSFANSIFVAFLQIHVSHICTEDSSLEKCFNNMNRSYSILLSTGVTIYTVKFFVLNTCSFTTYSPCSSDSKNSLRQSTII